MLKVSYNYYERAQLQAPCGSWGQVEDELATRGLSIELSYGQDNTERYAVITAADPELTLEEFEFILHDVICVVENDLGLQEADSTPRGLKAPSWDELCRLITEFYALGGLLAEHRSAWQAARANGDLPILDECPGPELEGQLYLRWVEAQARYTAVLEQLDVLFQNYLLFACMSEAHHGLKLAYGEALVQEYLFHKWIEMRCAAPPCPTANRGEALQWARILKAMFENLVWGDSDGEWICLYGGPRWAHIAEVLISRLTGKGLWADPTVFVDYVLDLQHNTGTVLDKGWIVVDEYQLSSLLNAKRYESVWTLLKRVPATHIGQAFARALGHVDQADYPQWEMHPIEDDDIDF